MGKRRLIPPFLRQLGGDVHGLGRAAQSVRSERLVARTRMADRVVQSICPYRGERQGASRRSPRVRAVRPDKGSPATAPIQLPAT